MKIETWAPAKAILFGEHYVVYGAEGICVALSPRNCLDVSIEKSDDTSLQYASTESKSSISQKPRECGDSQHPISALYCHYLKKFPDLLEVNVDAKLKKIWELKGVGNSASIASCFAFAIREYLEVENTWETLIDDVNIAETAAHGSPSGIDATAVVMGGAIGFKRNYGVRPSIKHMKFELPENYSLLLIDTYTLDGQRTSTKEMIRRFAINHGVQKKPQDMEQQNREQIFGEYKQIYDMAIDAMRSSDMLEMGEAMSKNQELLSGAQLSSPSIDLAINTAIQNGAKGAKLTGGGGIGGAVIALCEKVEVPKIESALNKKGFVTHEADISKKGVSRKD